MDKSLIVIPARYGSQRYPGKVLAPLAGKPVLQCAGRFLFFACYAQKMRNLVHEEAIALKIGRRQYFVPFLRFNSPA